MTRVAWSDQDLCRASDGTIGRDFSSTDSARAGRQVCVQLGLRDHETQLKACGFSAMRLDPKPENGCVWLRRRNTPRIEAGLEQETRAAHSSGVTAWRCLPGGRLSRREYRPHSEAGRVMS